MPSDRQTEIQAIRDALAARPDVGRTHWQGCATDPRHRDCALALVLGELSRVQQERDETVGRLLNRAGLAACGHYAVFTLMTVFEDGTERPTCMQCDRDAAQDRAEKAEAERDALTQEIATLKTVCPNCAGMMRPETEASGLTGVYCPECRERDVFQDDRIATLTQEIATLRQQIDQSGAGRR